ncbi:uncharacterized protein [Drosophila virilis]|uniref:uncharacterized protein n=1 Tax=Drosophila virilis TaxID=7244 RepID=UPI0013965B3E|nr:uncharacterized protein LOC6627399 [Drosophila virilis]
MLPSEQLRNFNQRLIPLTPELIQDMLDNEGLEYQTPPGGHSLCSEDYSLGSTSHNNAMQLQDEHRSYNSQSRPVRRYERSSTARRPNEESDSLEEDSHLKRQRARKHNPSRLSEPNYHLKLLYAGRQGQQFSSSTEDESSNLRNLLDMLRSAERHNYSKDTETSTAGGCTQAKQPETFSMEFLCIKPSRRCLYSTSSDSLISKPSKHLEKQSDLGEQNYCRINQHWINMMVVPKSETSFLLNQCKLQNFKTNSCNAYYTPKAKDFRRDREAVASLLARPCCKRNSRNAYW